MNGPEHYLAAEILLTKAQLVDSEIYAQQATAHALLALTAATIDSAYELADADDWIAVTRRPGAPP